VALHQHIEVHRVEAVRGRISEPADVSRCDRLGHPLHELPPVGGGADVPQATEAGAREPAKFRIADAEES